MPFEQILVAIDGSECSDRAFAKAIELANLTGAHLTALAIEGPLPAYAATIGEVDEVKREKDLFFKRPRRRGTRASRAGRRRDRRRRPGRPRRRGDL